MSKSMTKQDAIETLEIFRNDYTREDSAICQAIDIAIEALRETTIESEPVRYARWINDTFCSNCNKFPVPAGVSCSISDRELTKYFSRCPHCGAKMMVGDDNDT